MLGCCFGVSFSSAFGIIPKPSSNSLYLFHDPFALVIKSSIDSFNSVVVVVIIVLAVDVIFSTVSVKQIIAYSHRIEYVMVTAKCWYFRLISVSCKTISEFADKLDSSMRKGGLASCSTAASWTYRQTSSFCIEFIDVRSVPNHLQGEYVATFSTLK